MQQRAELLDHGFRVCEADCGKEAPRPLLGTLGRTGGVGSEVNIQHNLMSSTNGTQAGVAFVGSEIIQGLFRDYVEKR